MDTDLKITILDALDIEGEVLGGVLYSEPSKDERKVLRIELAPGRRSQEYEGLRVQVVHKDGGVIDSAVITFAETDALRGDKTTILGYLSDPLRGLRVAGLRDAVCSYASVWFTDPDLRR